MVTNTATTAGSATAAAAAAAAEEVAGLDRVLTRLALTDDDKLEKVLQRLIPLVIGQLKSPHPATFNKVREILSHVNKRLKSIPTMQLPLASLVTMYKGEPQPGTNPAQYGMVRNFSLVYAEMAAERAPGPDRLAALPILLPGLSKRPVDHQNILLRILGASLEHQPPPPISGGGLIPGLTTPSSPPTMVGETAVTAAAAVEQGATSPAAAEGTVSAAEAALRAKYPYLMDNADRTLFLSYGLKVMLYVPRTSRAPATPLAAGQAAAAAAAGGVGQAGAAAAPPPPGLSTADVKHLEAKGAPTVEQVSRRKLGLLNLLAAAGIGGPLLPVGAVLPHLLVGAADSAELVSRRAEELLKRSAALDPNRPAANLDDPDLVRQLLILFHGGAVELFFDGNSNSTEIGNGGNGAAAAAPPADQVATPAGPALRSRLATVFCRSITFVNTFPASLLTIQECVMPPQTSGAATAAVTGVFARLRQQGLELCVWVFKHGSRHHLKAMGPVVLQGLLDTLDASAPSSPGAPMDSPTMTLRGFAYQAIGSLAQRVPELLQPRIDIAKRFFVALADEPPGVRAAVQEATSALSRAFIIVQQHPASSGPATVSELGRVYGDRTAELDELLLESVRSPKDAVRLCAVQWACRLFPFQHVPARWICVLAAGDNKHDVREEAARGLKPPSPSSSSSSNPPLKSETSFSTAAATGRLPPLYALVRYARKQLPRLRYPADPLAPLPLAPRAFLALIALLRMCRRVPVHLAAAATAAATVGGCAGSAAGTAAPPPGTTDAMDVDADPAAAAATETSMEVEGPAAAAEPATSTDIDPDLMPYDNVALLSAYACVLEAGLCRVEGSSEVVAAALEALLEAAAEEEQEQEEGPGGRVLARRYAPRATWLRSFLSHTDPWARTAAAKLLGSHVVRVMTTEAAEELLNGLGNQLSTLTLQGRSGTGGAAVTTSDTGGALAASAASRAGSGATTSVTATTGAGSGAIKQEEAEGCLLAVGLITHSVSLGSPALEPATTAAAVRALAAVLRGSSGSTVQPAAAAAPIVRATAALALSYACAGGIQPALLTPEAAGPTTDMQVDGGPVAAATAAPPSRILDEAVKSILDLLAADSASSTAKDAKVASRAAAAAGFLAGGWGGNWMPEADVSRRLVDGLFGTASNKSEELQFSVGEALAWTFGGVSSATAAKVLNGNFTTLADQLTASATAAADGDAGGGDTDSEMQEPPPPPEAAEVEALEDGARSELRNRILKTLLSDLVVSPKTEVRCAGAVWLVSLLGFCGRTAALRGAELPKIQEALSGLLGDSNELTQEMASRGVSLVYRLGDAAVREQLVTRLVTVLQGSTGPGGGAGRPIKLTADTQIFEEGALGNAPGGGGGASGSGAGGGGGSSSGGLSTYKELCALATDLGQPDLIYKFMDLAHHAAALNSRRGAAFGFAGIARLASRSGGAPGEALAKHLAALVPKLYRYTHDPNPKVAEAMVAIWRSLVDDPRVTLDKHFAAIMTDLLREMGGRLWRNRQAACSALGDLLQGRRWQELSPYLSQIWIMTFREMDDIKDSVRRAALSLARTVRGLTLRLADPAHTPAKDCSSAVAVIMPVLLEQGLMSTVSEVRALSVEVLGLVAKTAPPPALRPLLPALVPALLEALSSLEDVRLNYVEQHAERLGLDSERLEGARVAAARASPLGDTLDLAARLADSQCLEQLVPALVGTVKRGVGLNTKVGVARFIRNLASRPGATTVTVPAATTTSASEPGAATDGTTEPLLRPHAGPLLRVLVAAVLSERSGTVRRAYAAAAAQVVRHAGEKRLDKFVAEAVESYTDPGADVESRLSGGLILRELLRAAPEKLRMYDTVILPAAFGAKMDEDKEVAAVWAEIWEEGVSSEPAALRLYGKEICTTLCEMLGGQQWGRKKAAAEATIKLTEIAPDALGEYGRRLASALLAELGVGRLWDGKEAVLRALAALVAAGPRVLEPTPGHIAVVDALMAAVGRKKMAYRKAALAALEVVLRALPGCHYERVAPPLLAAVARHCEAGGAVAEAEGTPLLPAVTAAAPPSASSATAAATAAEDDGERPLPLPECLSCLSAAFARLGVAGSETSTMADTTAAAEAVSEQGVGLATALRGVLTAQVTWHPKLAAAAAVQVLAQRCTAAGVQPRVAASLLGPLAPVLLRSAHEHKIQQLRLAA
ncbi:hypothetical protein VaNZ11_002209, partial [Volvox africanus]